MRVALATCLLLVVAGALPTVSADEPGADGWRSFEGTWSATGRRRSIAVEGGGAATVVEVSGAVVLDGGDLRRGFRGQAIGFDDGQGLSVGRCVWTDDRGDQLFSRLKGDGLQAGRRFVGTITGGTGRYADLVGEYSFTWQYVLAADDDVVQGRAVGLSGRVHRASAAR